MTVAKLMIALFGLLCLLAPSAASAATAKRCGDSEPHGITRVAATNLTCATAVKVARNYNFSKLSPKIMNGWRCRGTRVSSTRERVACRKGSRKVAFRSTYNIELPPAVALPIANGGG